jgi:hypothetical protein
VVQFSNDDVRWDGDFTGLSPTFDAEQTRELAALGEAVMPDLVRALHDPDRFVAAHVLLTRLSGVEYQSEPGWNGLAVNLAPDGTVRIERGQRAGLARRWARWLSAEPRPLRLPADD